MIYTINDMDSDTFEHMGNALALRVLGPGLTVFGPGADGGRDGLFRGECAYPSSTEKWSGIWYIQSKFHKPNLSTNHNKWLVDQVKEELKLFSEPSSLREWPDNWIIITNVDPSGKAKAGAFDTIMTLIKTARPGLEKHTSIWSGEKIKTLLSQNKDVASRYGSFLTPGNILAELQNKLNDTSASVNDIIRYLVVTQFTDQQYTKLEQAGSSSDNRPGIEKLFRDIPFASVTAQTAIEHGSMAAYTLARTLAQNHTVDNDAEYALLSEWQRQPQRARIWFVKGGPGQGKSTLTQYFCQIQRAALISGSTSAATKIAPKLKPLLASVKKIATEDGLWPKMPRIPVTVELKEYAKWMSLEEPGSKSLITYIASKITSAGGLEAFVGTLKRAFSLSRWMFVFDGMDEVPGDVKDRVAKEVVYFVDDLLIGCACDAHIICTSRPQGYSGQFDALDSAEIRLSSLNADQALNCAVPILEIDRSPEEGGKLRAILQEALGSQSIREIMTTPLQAHIMAVVVRDGGRPPERKWELFSNFYKVINKREAEKSADKKLSSLLKGHGKLIKALHNRLGFELHARAEKSVGAQTSLERSELVKIIEETVGNFQTENKAETVKALEEATTDRLVLVNTPENGSSIRFDIRPLQEFFAAEYIYETADFSRLNDRVRTISSDSHWREVLHFLLSALIENERRSELAQVVQVLAEVDDPVCEKTRPLARKLAIGSHVVGRLLQEGVLEEDRRIRQSFKGCLMPLFSTTDPQNYLGNVERVYSRHWLEETLKEALLDQVEPENIGAAILAMRLVGDDSRHVSDIEKVILNSSMAYKAAIFKSIGFNRINSRNWKIPLWSKKIIYQTLASENWYDLGEDGIQSAYNALRESQGVPDIFSFLEFSQTTQSILRTLMSGFTAMYKGREKTTAIQYGLVEVSLHEMPDLMQITKWSSDTLSEMETLTGVFKVAWLVMKASSGMCEPQQVWENIGRDAARLVNIPPQARSFVNLSHLYSHPDIKDLPDDLFVPKNPGKHVTFSLFGPAKGKADWVRFAHDYPQIAIHFLTMHRFELGGRELKDIIASPQEKKSLLDALSKNPGQTLCLSAMWGRLIKIMPELEGELRTLYIKAADYGKVGSWQYDTDFYPFTLRLPDEACLLPYIMSSIVKSALEFRNDRHAHGRGLTDKIGELSGCAARVVECGLTKPSLDNIVNDLSLTSDIRGAAHVLSVMLSPTPTGMELEEISEKYSPGISDWFLPAVGLVASEAIKDNKDMAKAAVSRLLQKAREDYASRINMETILGRWREITRSPVAKSHPEIWRTSPSDF